MSGERLRVGLGRHPSQLRVRPGFVVVAPPGFEHDTGVRQGWEQRLVQQFVAQPTIEALVEAVLLRLARRDVMPAYAGVVGPGQDGVGRIFRAVVADDRLGSPSS